MQQHSYSRLTSNRSNERNIQGSPISTLKLATEELRRPHDEFPLPLQLVLIIIHRNNNAQNS